MSHLKGVQHTTPSPLCISRYRQGLPALRWLLALGTVLALSILASSSFADEEDDDPEDEMPWTFRAFTEPWTEIATVKIDEETGNPYYEVDLSGERLHAAKNLFGLLDGVRRNGPLRSRLTATGKIVNHLHVSEAYLFPDGSWYCEASRYIRFAIGLNSSARLWVSDSTGGGWREWLFSTDVGNDEFLDLHFDATSQLLRVRIWAFDTNAEIAYLPRVEQPHYSLTVTKRITAFARASATSVSATFSGRTDGKESDPAKVGLSVQHAYEKFGSLRRIRTRLDKVKSTAVLGGFRARARTTPVGHEVVFTLFDSWTSEIDVAMTHLLTDTSIECKEKGLSTFEVGFNISDADSTEPSVEAKCESSSTSAEAIVRWKAHLADPLRREGRVGGFLFVTNLFYGDASRKARWKHNDWIERYIQPWFFDNQLYSIEAANIGGPGVTLGNPKNSPRYDVFKKRRLFRVDVAE